PSGSTSTITTASTSPVCGLTFPQRVITPAEPPGRWTQPDGPVRATPKVGKAFSTSAGADCASAEAGTTASIRASPRVRVTMSVPFVGGERPLREYRQDWSVRLTPSPLYPGERAGVRGSEI